MKGLDGTIAIAPGDRMPPIPRHTFKLFTDIELTPRLSLNLDLVDALAADRRPINNVLDQRYDTAALLGPAGFTGAGTFAARTLSAVNGSFRCGRRRSWRPVRRGSPGSAPGSDSDPAYYSNSL